jgi:acetyltransferase
MQPEEHIDQRGRHLVLRPIRAEDDARHREFLARIASQDLYLRFFAGIHELSETERTRLTHIDNEREMAFVAVADAGEPGAGEILAVARASADPDNSSAEFAVLVRSDLKGQGLGTLLMRRLISYCREHGTRELRGSVLAENTAMRRLCATLGFRVRGCERNVLELALDLSGYTARESGTTPAVGA